MHSEETVKISNILSNNLQLEYLNTFDVVYNIAIYLDKANNFILILIKTNNYIIAAVNIKKRVCNLFQNQ